MHAVVGRVAIDSERADEARELLDTFTWMRALDGKGGTSVLLVESEAAARAIAERMAQGPPTGSPVTFVSSEVSEVLARA